MRFLIGTIFIIFPSDDAKDEPVDRGLILFLLKPISLR